MIKNVRGWDGLGVNHYDRGRKGNKVSLIVTSDGIPLSMNLTSSNIHDVHLVNDLIDRIHIKIVGSKLVGGDGKIKITSEIVKSPLNLRLYP